MNYHLDYETFSEVDIGEAGAYRYAADPSTEILMAAISTEDEGPYLWVNPKYETIELLSDDRALPLIHKAFLDEQGLIWAHNAQFEIAISTYRALPDLGVAMTPTLHRWRCTAALARRAGLPDSLEKVSEALKVGNQKDSRGKDLIKKFSMLQTPRKKKDPEQPWRITAHDEPEEFAAFGAYCLQDVRAEMDVFTKLKPFEFRGALLDMFLFDMELNWKGIPVNVPALHNAKAILDVVLVENREAFERLTGLMPTQRQKVKDLLASMGLDLPDMQADTITEALKQARTGDNPRIVRILELYAVVQYAAAKKVYTMLNCVCPDGFVRGCLLFYGAGTGRWAGRLIQPQNFKKPTIKGTDLAYDMICSGHDKEALELIFPNALEVIASCIRNFIQPHTGDLIDADYNAIEARIVCWLADQEDVLEMYRNGRDLYKYMAGLIYNRPESEIINPSDERELGKRTILGCGFNMGAAKFKLTCEEQYGIIISEELAVTAVDMYRKLCWKVAELWGDVDQAARLAITRPGQRFPVGKLVFQVSDINGVPYLLMKLPSGRPIAYPWPELVQEYDERYQKMRTKITFYGNIKDKLWGRVSTYGGKLVENATQGTAADIMGHGAVNATRKGFEIITLIHDQAPCLRKPGQTVEQYCAALTELPPWADGLPIKAEGKIIPYYKK